MKNPVVRPCTPAQSLQKSLIEMKLMREGKMDKIPYLDAIKDLDINNHNEQNKNLE